jgi:hypothetical protein
MVGTMGFRCIDRSKTEKSFMVTSVGLGFIVSYLKALSFKSKALRKALIGQFVRGATGWADHRFSSRGFRKHLAEYRQSVD